MGMGMGMAQTERGAHFINVFPCYHNVPPKFVLDLSNL